MWKILFHFSKKCFIKPNFLSCHNFEIRIILIILTILCQRSSNFTAHSLMSVFVSIYSYKYGALVLGCASFLTAELLVFWSCGEENSKKDIQSIHSISNRFMCKAGRHCCSADIMNICECLYGMWILISVSNVSVRLQYILGKIVLAIAFSICAHVIYNACQISNGNAKAIWHLISNIRAGMAQPYWNSSSSGNFISSLSRSLLAKPQKKLQPWCNYSLYANKGCLSVICCGCDV